MKKLEIHGHRGARGSFPENTLPAFAAAIEWGVDAIEMDVCISADDVLVLSHDLFLNPCLSRSEAGDWLQPPTPAIRNLTLEDLGRINIGAANAACGYAQRWPDQCALPHASIPTLAEVVALTKKKGAMNLLFNIELKSDPYQPDLTPPAKVYAQLLLAEIRRQGIGGRLFLQSFDWRLLETFKALQPTLEPGYLTSRQPDFNTLDLVDGAPSRWTANYDIDRCNSSIPQLVVAAGGKIWSSNHLDLTPDNISEALNLGLKIYAWTVNDQDTMQWLLTQGVTAITTDYPQRMLQITRKQQLTEQ